MKFCCVLAQWVRILEGWPKPQKVSNGFEIFYWWVLGVAGNESNISFGKQIEGMRTPREPQVQ